MPINADHTPSASSWQMGCANPTNDSTVNWSPGTWRMWPSVTSQAKPILEFPSERLQLLADNCGRAPCSYSDRGWGWGWAWVGARNAQFVPRSSESEPINSVKHSQRRVSCRTRWRVNTSFLHTQTHTHVGVGLWDDMLSDMDYKWCCKCPSAVQMNRETLIRYSVLLVCVFNSLIC